MGKVEREWTWTLWTLWTQWTCYETKPSAHMRLPTHPIFFLSYPVPIRFYLWSKSPFPSPIRSHPPHPWLIPLFSFLSLRLFASC